MAAASHQIWVLHMGGLGDLVLAAGLLNALRRLPDTRITLAARRALIPVASLYPDPPDGVFPLDVSPGHGLAVTPELLSQLRAQVTALGGDTRAGTVIAADFQPGFCMPVLAAALRPDRAIVSEAAWPAAFTRELLRKLEMAESAVAYQASGVSGPHEQQRYDALAKLAGCDDTARSPARWPKPARPARLDRPYLVCFPLSAPSNRAKRWPADRFQQLAAECCSRRGWDLVLPGDPAEQAELEAFAAPLREQQSIGAVHVRTTPTEELTSLAALVANAEAYLGNSTGGYHLASAYEVPGVAVHSGDTWPNYGPWARGSVGVVHPLPCFRCHHDCLFGRGICAESIPPKTVMEALDSAIAAPAAPPRVVSMDELSAETHRIIGEANASYRAAQRDRAAQNESMVELHAQLEAAIRTVEAKHSVQAHMKSAFELIRERFGL